PSCARTETEPADRARTREAVEGYIHSRAATGSRPAAPFLLRSARPGSSREPDVECAHQSPASSIIPRAPPAEAAPESATAGQFRRRESYRLRSSIQTNQSEWEHGRRLPASASAPAR